MSSVVKPARPHGSGSGAEIVYEDEIMMVKIEPGSAHPDRWGEVVVITLNQNPDVRLRIAAIPGRLRINGRLHSEDFQKKISTFVRRFSLRPSPESLIDEVVG